ncbi:IclR family transcriptional regulator [Effusibacillus consociatus]|uniref:IclR family transcriptional regulator n=1 Tax=Effusibacillus consociatus TaxID=1117041 RepID=A0ABV9PWJ6_9BACL
MVQTIDRAMDIIKVLVSDDNKDDWSISELSEKTSLPRSTLHRLLSSMMKHGLVGQAAETKHYKAGYTWIEFGLQLLDKIDFRTVARPVMERLAVEVEESIYLNISDGTDGIVIEKIDSPLKVRIAENLGIRIPLHIGAPNKVILAHMKDNEINYMISELQVSAKETQEFLERLSEIKRQGYAVSYGEKTEGTASVAAPIIGYKKKVIAALSINVPIFRFTENRLPILIEKVIEAAEEISIKIGKR